MNIVSPLLKWTALTGPPATPIHWTLGIPCNKDDLRAALSVLRRWTLYLFVLLGACAFYDQAIGDGPLPPINNLSAVSEFRALSQVNSTLDVPPALTSTEGWQALSQSRALLAAISPEIEEWLDDLKRKDKITYGKAPTTLSLYKKQEGTPIFAAYEPLGGKLYIGTDFWDLSNGEKAVILAHEYRHARQNWPKLISIRLTQGLWGGQLNDQSRLENEAFDYERQARAALGLSPLLSQTP